MPNPTLPADGYGTIPWQNDIHNWRANDAAWLQGRGIVRWATDAARNASAPADGTIGYVAATQKFLLRSGGVDRTPFFLTNVVASVDTASAVNLKLATGTTGIQIEPSKVSISAMGTFVAGAFTASATGISLTATDASTVSISKDTTALGGALRVVGGVVATGAVDCDTTLNVDGATTLNTLTVNGVTNFKNGVTLSGGIISGTLGGSSTVNTTGNITTTGTTKLGSITIATNSLTNGTSSVVISDTAGITLQTAGGQRAKVNDGSALPGNIATVVVDTVAPSGQDYPEGCIWVQI